MKDQVVPVFISEAKEEMKECPLHPKVCLHYSSLGFTKDVIRARFHRDSGAITRDFTAAISARFLRDSSAISGRFKKDFYPI